MAEEKAKKVGEKAGEVTGKAARDVAGGRSRSLRG